MRAVIGQKREQFWKIEVAAAPDQENGPKAGITIFKQIWKFNTDIDFSLSFTFPAQPNLKPMPVVPPGSQVSNLQYMQLEV